MRISDLRSITIVSLYVLANSLILIVSFQQAPKIQATKKLPHRALAPEFIKIENLNYFHLRDGVPQMSLAADAMSSQGEDLADFVSPRGLYNYESKKESIRYQAKEGYYRKANEVLLLQGEVKLISSDALYNADNLKFFFKKDLLIGKGHVFFEGEDLQSKDKVIIYSDALKASPQKKMGNFAGSVRGSMERKKKYEGRMTFSADELQLDGVNSLAKLLGDVVLNRGTYRITSGKADMYLENYNKSLKYFVLNDDVKVTETLQTPEGTTQRRAYAERLEGFGREQKMVLSGAPRVEQGADVIKGYRITIRENVDMIEVDDAMSDVQVKRNKLKDK